PFSQDDWYGVIIFPSRNLEPKNTTIHQPLLNSNKVRIIYLDELDDSEEQSIGILKLCHKYIQICSDVSILSLHHVYDDFYYM
ncbi:MAG: DUF2887 domain-containing protein, partial [Cyanobacteria bacterium P01_H01_bin.150]